MKTRENIAQICTVLHTKTIGITAITLPLCESPVQFSQKCNRAFIIKNCNAQSSVCYER